MLTEKHNKSVNQSVVVSPGEMVSHFNQNYIIPQHQRAISDIKFVKGSIKLASSKNTSPKNIITKG